MSSFTLNRKYQTSPREGVREGRRNSEDGLLSATGTLRRTAAIPVMEEDNVLSPLKQLQRLNQNGSFRVVAKNRPSLPVPSHARSNSADKSSTGSSSPSSSMLSLESSCKKPDTTESSFYNNNVDKRFTSKSSDNLCQSIHSDRPLTENNSQNTVNSSSDTNGNISSPDRDSGIKTSPSDTSSEESGSSSSKQAKVANAPQESDQEHAKDKPTSINLAPSGSDGSYVPTYSEPSFNSTEKSFCPLALDLHPHQSHIVDFTRHYGPPNPKPDPPQLPATKQQVVVEVHRTDSPDSPQQILKGADTPLSASNDYKSSSDNQDHSQASTVAPNSENLPQDNPPESNHQNVTSPTQCSKVVPQSKPLSPVSEGPVILIQGESVYDVPRSLNVKSGEVKSPTSLAPSQSRRRLSRPKCKAPPPPTSPRTTSVRDSLCSSSSTQSVNSSASSHCESVTSHSSGISSSGSALSRCSQSTLTSNGEGHRSGSETPTHRINRPKGPAPPPPGNRTSSMSQRPPPMVFHDRAVSEPRECATSLLSPQDSNYDTPRSLVSPHSPRPASIAPSWKCPAIESTYDVVRSPEATSPLARNVEVRRSTLGTTGEIKVTPIPRESSQCSTFLTLAPKPVIDVKLVKNERKPNSPHPKGRFGRSTEEMNTLNRERMSKSEEDIEKKYADLIEGPPPRPISPTIRNSFMGSDVEIPRESVYNSMGEMNTILKTTAPEKEKIYSLPQPQCYGDDTLKAVKAITEKYDTLERHRQRAVSFRENSRPSISGGAKSEPTSPMLVIQEVSASDPQLTDATDFVFPEGSQGGITERACDRVSDHASEHASDHLTDRISDQASEPGLDQAGPSSSNKRAEDPPGSPRAILDMSYGGLQARDIARIDLFYRGRGTEVVVCSCMAALSIGMPSAVSDEINTWEGPLHNGVPVIVLNTGAGKRSRELFVVLAERETGFPLWQDKISYLTNYHQMSPLVHALSPANNLRQKVAITFMEEQAAEEFYQRFKEITSDPSDELWKISNAKPDKKHRRLSFRRKKSSKKTTDKTAISAPCNFTHLTNIDPKDRRLGSEGGCHVYPTRSILDQQQRKLKTKTM